MKPSYTSQPLALWQWTLPSVVAILLAFHYGVCTQDDAFISFRYAENWASGLGWVFNVDEYVEGFSNPLWTGLFGLIFWMNGDPVQWSLLMGYLSIAFLVFSTHHLLVTLQLSSRWIWVGTILIAVDPSMVLEAVQGLESVFYSGLLVLMISHAMRERKAARVHTISLVLAMMLCLTRPEAPLFVGLLYTGLWINDLDWKRSLIPLGLMGVFLSLLTVGRLVYFGDPLPNTFYAKVGGWAWERGLLYCWAHFKHHPILWLGMFASIRLYKEKSVRLLLWVLLPYLLYVISIGGDFKPTGRFLLPAGGLLVAITMQFVQSISSVRSKSVMILILCISLLSRATLIPKTNQWAEIRRNNLIARKVVGDWLARFTPPNTVLAMHSIGVVPFYAQRHTIDMWGLTDRTIAKTPASDFGSGMAGHEKTNPEYVFSKNPDLYLPEDGFFQPDKKMQTVEPGFPTDFVDLYRPISIPIEGSWLNIWVHEDFKLKGGFGEWKKVPIEQPN